MNYKYFPHTDTELKEMLEVCGKRTLDELFDEIPENIQFKRDYNLPSEMSEVELRRFFAELGAKNKPLTCFAGAGYRLSGGWVFQPLPVFPFLRRFDL